MAAGQSGTLYLKMHFKNMTTKNGTTAKFVDMKMTGSMVNENGSYTINPVSVLMLQLPQKPVKNGL